MRFVEPLQRRRARRGSGVARNAARMPLTIRTSGPEHSAPTLIRETLPFLLPRPRLTLLIRRILPSQWDQATWPIAKAELAKALELRSVVERVGWWN